MSQYNFEGQPEGEWDDRGDLSWSELDWQRFLRRQEKEVAKFLQLYDECSSSNVDRLDHVAKQMGWDSTDWSVSEILEDEDDEDFIGPWGQEPTPDESNMDGDPYTIHRHPAYVVSSGLFIQLRFIWKNVLKNHRKEIDAMLAWDFAESLNESEKHCLLALMSMDMGDFMLCVVHMKRCLRGLNLSMSLVPSLAVKSPVPEHFRRNVLSRLFDLRELSLRMINDCRTEDKG